MKEYITMNGLANIIDKEKYKTQNDLAIEVLRVLTEIEDLTVPKIVQLFLIGSRTYELQNDKLYWQMLSNITVANETISSKLTLSMAAQIGYAISRLQNHKFVNEKLIDDLCVRLSDHDKKRLNIIDINQILTFYEFIEQQTGKQFDLIWRQYEDFFIDESQMKLDAKNFAIMAYRFSQNRKGSMEFWRAMDQRFTQVQSTATFQDLAQIIHSFSLVNLISSEKFMQIVIDSFTYKDITQLKTIDLAQILSTAKNQNFSLSSKESNHQFWSIVADIVEEVVFRDIDNINRQTYIVLLNSLYHNLSRAQYKSQWRLMDKLLLKHFDEIKMQARNSFIVVRAYLFNDFSSLSPGVGEIIYQIMAHNINCNAKRLNGQDIALCFKLLSQRIDESNMKKVITLCKELLSEISNIDKQQIKEIVDKTLVDGTYSSQSDVQQQLMQLKRTM